MIGIVIPACATVTATPPISRVAVDSEAMTTTTVRQHPSTTKHERGQTETGPPSVTSDALITPSGVIIAILEESEVGFTVRTPCGNESFIAVGTPVGGIEVVLDPGHGGAVDPGAVGPNGLEEETINLRVARATQSILESRGIATALTRTGDYASPLGVRTGFADHVGADLMISIHHNAPTANLGAEPGTEIFVQQDSADSRRLGQLVYSSVIDGFKGFHDIVWSTSPDAGVLEVLNTRDVDAYGILRNTETVSVLAELAYISHAPEAELLMTPQYLEVASTAIADGVGAYLNSDEVGHGYVDEPRIFNPQRGISPGVCEDPDLG